MHNKYGPRFHYAPLKGWINDPNGLVYFNGTWHLFYQYYEPSIVDGMQWGHAISKNLVEWEHLEPALQPDSLGEIWSGSAVVDHDDSSGLFDGGSGIVCLYTYRDRSDSRQSQGLAYSADGITFHKHNDNPVIGQLRTLPEHPDDKDFRDPKVFRHARSGKWIMVVAGGKLRIFSSSDLIHWDFESVDESIETECPDLFELPVDGSMSTRRWVLSLGGRSYLVGDFDGTRFTPTSERLPMSAGPDYYASQSFSDAPDNRRILISWMFDWWYGTGLSPSGIHNVFPTGEQAGGCLSVPYELSLRSSPDGPRLVQMPVAELDRLRKPVFSIERMDLTMSAPFVPGPDLRTADIELSIARCESGRVGFRIPATGECFYAFGYDSVTGELFIDRRACGLDSVESFCRLSTSSPVAGAFPVTLRVLVDTCSVEVFAADGTSHMAAHILPDPDRSGLSLFCDSRAVLENVAVYEMVKGQ